MSYRKPTSGTEINSSTDMELFIRSTKQVGKKSLTSVVTALSKLAFGKKQKISTATNGEGRLGDVKICLEMEDDIFKYFQLAEVCKLSVA